MREFFFATEIRIGVVSSVKRELMRNAWWFLHRRGFNVRRSEQWCWPDQAALAGEGVRCVFDVGANCGEVAQKYLTDYLGAVVHCFEALPEFANAIRQRFPTHERVGVIEAAVGDRDGEAEFFVNAAKDTSSLLAPDSESLQASYQPLLAIARKIDVRLLKLDSYCRDKCVNQIDILKMDVQGGELSVLRGANELLRRGAIRVIYTEVFFASMYKDQPLFGEIAEHLVNFGYHFHGLYNLTFAGGSGRLRWGDAIFVAPNLRSHSMSLLRAG